MGQVVNLPQLPVGVALAGGLAVFEVYAWFVVGEIIGKRQLIGRFLFLALLKFSRLLSPWCYKREACSGADTHLERSAP